MWIKTIVLRWYASGPEFNVQYCRKRKTSKHSRKHPKKRKVMLSLSVASQIYGKNQMEYSGEKQKEDNAATLKYN